MPGQHRVIDFDNAISTNNSWSWGFSLLTYGVDINTLWVTVAAILLSSTILSLIFKSWTVSAARKNGEPPLVPYTIPWLGHGLSFMRNINSFTKWVR